MLFATRYKLRKHSFMNIMNNSYILIRGVFLYGEGSPVDVLITNDKISKIDFSIPVPLSKSRIEIIEAFGQVLLPGFVDLHTHLRDPDKSHLDDIATGSAAAALGGYTAVFAMANTEPTSDNYVFTDYIWSRGKQVGLVDIYPVGSVTIGRNGKQITEMSLMANSIGQVSIFSDDGLCVQDSLVMRRALEYSTDVGVLIAQHAEDSRLTLNAVAHEGSNSSTLGLVGWPRSAEESIVARDIILARDANARIHICHISALGTVELLKWAKSQSISITSEVTPHHLMLDDNSLKNYDGHKRVNPPLREANDIKALRQALADGVIDCVATDHAPHSEHEKQCEFSKSKPGMIGLQTSLPIVVCTMLHPDLLDWRGVARVMSETPAAIAGLSDQGRPLEVGEPANLAVVNPNSKWKVKGSKFASYANNTPFESLDLKTKITATLLRGQITASANKLRTKNFRNLKSEYFNFN